MELIAYRVHDQMPVDTQGRSFRIEPAGRKRAWMDATREGAAYRCLPLVMANQIGWVITCPAEIHLSWDGGNAPDAMRVTTDAYWKSYVLSHFGSGILTFSLPWMFRINGDPEMGLLVRGPTNLFLPRLAALDGYVEAAWLSATFTMNWKMTEPGEAHIPEGFPVCMIIPMKPQQFETFEVAERNLSDDAPTHTAYRAWAEARQKFIKREIDTSAGWQKHYFRGETVDGTPRDAPHLSKVSLKPFKE